MTFKFPLAAYWTLALAWLGLSWAIMGLHAGKTVVAPCSACSAIAKELSIRIKNEKPRNHIDMRSRLDSSGNRFGKVIDYRFSETRAIELLDKLCVTISPYHYVTTKLSTSGRTTKRWVKTSGQDADFNTTRDERLASDEENLLHKSLVSYCGWLTEVQDEALTHGLMSGALTDAASVHDFLCRNLTKTCPGKDEPDIVFIDDVGPGEENAIGQEQENSKLVNDEL